MNQEIIRVKGNQMWKVREAAAEKALNQSLDTQLWYTLFQICTMKACTMKRKRNGYVELIFQTTLSPTSIFKGPDHLL